MITQKEVKKDKITDTLKEVLDLLVNAGGRTEKIKFSVEDFDICCKDEEIGLKFTKLKQ